VSAGNASGICDGAAANVVVSEEALGRYGIKPLAKVLSYHVVAVEPSIMGESRTLLLFECRSLLGETDEEGSRRTGIGPVEAIKGALEKASLKMSDIDVRSFHPFFTSSGGESRDRRPQIERSTS